MEQKLFAELILPFKLKGSFTYAIPSNMQADIKVGCMVLVSFGKAHLHTAMVSAIHSNQPNYNTKAILELVSTEALYSEKHLKLWEWMSDYYLCSIGEIFQAACPGSLLISSNTFLKLKETFDTPMRELPEREQSVVNYLLQNENTKLNVLIKNLGLKTLANCIKSLKEKGFLESYEKLEKKYAEKQVCFIELPKGNLDDEANKLKGSKQIQLYARILEEHCSGVKRWEKKTFLKSNGFSNAVLKALVDKKYLQLVYDKVSRIRGKAASSPIPELNQEQGEVLANMLQDWKKRKVQLLFGVTSSGKTEVYAHLIQKEIEMGNQVLYLLPEIGLTSQLVNRLSAYFGEDLLSYHSRMSDAEQYEVWKEIQSGKPCIVLGTRSAIFLPFQKAALIIVDEEHDNSYKQQDPSPRYHARDVAVYLSELQAVKVLLGSATPSLESYYNALHKKYGLNKLLKRFGNWKMPEIIISDMKEEYRKKKNKASFGSTLYNAINTSLENKEQVILFQNRRGFSPYIQCANCGDIPGCPNCDISLTYHKFKHILSCHYCGFSISAPNSCSSCHSGKIITKGIGTEKLEEELNLLFPDARIARMDLDTTRGKKAFDKITENMQNGNTDILVGTQMLTKGFDFANIGLVGVINADNLMFFPDFRAFEKSFQLLTQISGRAGRRSNKAKVIIQSFQTDTDVIISLTNSSVEAFMESQLNERQIFKYPPYTRLIEITLLHVLKNKLEEAATKLKNISTFAPNVQVLGPDFESVERLRAMYRKRMILKFPKLKHHAVKIRLQEVVEQFLKLSEAKGVRLIINVDPL